LQQKEEQPLMEQFISKQDVEEDKLMNDEKEPAIPKQILKIPKYNPNGCMEQEKDEDKEDNSRIINLYKEGFATWEEQVAREGELDNEAIKNLKYPEWFCEAPRVSIEVISI
jgi:hypothetical protein